MLLSFRPKMQTFLTIFNKCDCFRFLQKKKLYGEYLMHQNQENLSFIFFILIQLKPTRDWYWPPPPFFFWKPIFFLSLHKKNKYLAMQSQFFRTWLKIIRFTHTGRSNFNIRSKKLSQSPPPPPPPSRPLVYYCRNHYHEMARYYTGVVGSGYCCRFFIKSDKLGPTISSACILKMKI